jgi:ketose-bisphosphate aldolase
MVSMTRLLEDARRGSYAVAYFEAWDAYSLEATLEAAEAENAPTILGFGGMMADTAWLESGGIETLAAIGRAACDRARVPVALLWNEAQTLAQCRRGVEAGFNAVMLDSTGLSAEDATAQVADLARFAHEHGATVEAELGHLADADPSGAFAGGDRTNPDEAAAFVDATGIDCLAVAIGNVHLLTDRDAPIDLAHLAAIRSRLGVPLAIHGGSSFPTASVPGAIALGVAKMNVGSILKRVFLDAIRKYVAGLDPGVDVHEVMGSHKSADLLCVGKAAIVPKMREMLRLYGASGRAKPS